MVKKEEDKKQKEKSKYSHMAEAQTSIKYLTCQTVLSAVFVLYIAFGYVYSLWSQVYLQSVDQAWATAPIVDIQFLNVASSSTSCPAGYEVATSTIFEGTRSGCDCSSSKTGLYQKLERGYCENDQTLAGCFTIVEQGPQTL